MKHTREAVLASLTKAIGAERPGEVVGAYLLIRATLGEEAELAYGRAQMTGQAHYVTDHYSFFDGEIDAIVDALNAPGGGK